jgi:integrase
VVWLRAKGLGAYIHHVGFKNSEANEGCKEQPLFPEPYFALKALKRERRTGLIFQVEGEHFRYRQIEFAYNKAFELAGLPYRGTHIMRHGGTRLVYNATKDLEVAKQILGNRDLQTVQVYAQRDATALTQFAHERWKSAENVVALPRK